MKVRKEAIKSLETRYKVSCEVNVRNRKRIEETKYTGVKRNMQKYQKLIYETMYDPNLIKELIKEDNTLTEGLGDVFQKYLEIIRNRLVGLVDEIDELFDDTYEKGSKRIMTKNGETVNVDEEEINENPTLQIIKTRQFEYLENITQQQQKIVQQELTNSVSKGLSIEDTATNMTKRIDGMTKARARTISRTEIVKAHNEGQVQTMRNLGVSTYIYWTAGDSKVADICRHNQGPRSKPKIYQLNGAGTPNQPLPVINSHPNCRCSILIND